jgi:hypothetical protein
MKNLFFISIALVLGLSACGQKVKKEDVPAAITAKFATLYPSVTDVKWSKEDANYEAEFDLNKSEASVLIDSLGNLLETETEITTLPQVIQDYINKNLAGEKVKESSKIVDSAGKVTYEAEIKGADYIFDEQGNLLNKEENKVEDKD